MRIEERKQVQTKDGLTVTSYELLVIAECQADFEMLDRIGKPGTTFTGEVRYSALMIRPQGSSNHSERARDAVQPVETAEESATNNKDQWVNHASSCYCSMCRDTSGKQHPVLYSGIVAVHQPEG